MSTKGYCLIRAIGQQTSSPQVSAHALPGFAATAATHEPPMLSITHIEVSEAELLALSKQPGYLGAAPPIPTALIGPVEASAAATASGQKVAWGISEVGAQASAFDGAGVRVAVLDTGIDASHPAFAGVQLDRRDFTGTGDADAHGHGTHCAGTVFGRDVNGVRIGVARGVDQAMIGKVLDAKGEGTSEMMFEAMLWAIHGGARVISMSIGLDYPGYVRQLVEDEDLPVQVATSHALRGFLANVRAFDTLMAYARAQVGFGGGAVVVAASGNESSHPQYPVSASLPAAADGVISVGAVAQTATGVELARFSNTDCQLVAPGVNVYSAQAGGGLSASNGTSMACPHVAGAAALWWQALRVQGAPTHAGSVTARLLAGADRSRIAGFDPYLHGEGLVRAP